MEYVYSFFVITRGTQVTACDENKPNPSPALAGSGTLNPRRPADIVEVKIPKALAIGDKLFARLNVAIAP